jgi:hypothetical protein
LPDPSKIRTAADLVLQRGDAKRSQPAVRLRYIPAAGSQSPIRARVDAFVKTLEVLLEVFRVIFKHNTVDAGSGGLLQTEEARSQDVDGHVMQERGQWLCRVPVYGVSYAGLRM